MVFSPPPNLLNPLETNDKVLLGPGPSNVPSRVLKSLSRQIMGHMHPETLRIMDEVKEGCKYIFQTRNPVTLCISASGHGGMEAALCNLIEDGDVVLIAVSGLWGLRAAEIAGRYGGDVHTLTTTLGQALSYDEIEAGLKTHRPKVLFLTQGESSTGVLQPLVGIGDLCHRYNCLLVVDTVASLGGTPFFADDWKVDVVYTGSQKVLGAPPGITPISFSHRAMSKVADRKTRSKVFYWDINLLANYWNCFGQPRVYHHTIPVNLLYGLREALSMACLEGLPFMIERHEKCAAHLRQGLQQMGLKLFVNQAEHRLPTVTSIHIPDGIDPVAVAAYAMKMYSVEIAGGLGPTAGKIFRIGLMGVNGTIDKVDLALKVLKESMDATRKTKSKL